MRGNIALLTLNVVAGGALAQYRGVTYAGAYPSAGGAVFGFTRTSAAASGDLVPADVVGTAIVEAGGTVTEGAAVKVDNTGKVVDHDSTNVKVGRALSGGASGDLVEILIFPSA